MPLSATHVTTYPLSSVPEWLTQFNEFLASPLFSFGEKVVSVGFVTRVVFGLLCLAIFARLTRKWIVPRLFRRTKVDVGVQHATARIAGYCIWIIGALVGLPLLGIPINSIVLAFSALGVGLGFGLQNIADNFVSGLILLFERPVKVGDRIQVGDVFGSIREIHARSTLVETNENVSILLPNSELISKAVTNLTHNGDLVRCRFPVGVAYGSDVEIVREALEKVAADHDWVLSEPPPEVLFMGFGDSSLDFVLRAASRLATHHPDTLRSEMNFSIFREFKARGIAIPFPQRDLHLRSVDATVATAIGRLA